MRLGFALLLATFCAFATACAESEHQEIRAIAYAKYVGDNRSQIWIATPDGNDPHRLTNGRRPLISVVRAGTGARIAGPSDLGSGCRLALDGQSDGPCVDAALEPVGQR